MAIRRVLQLKIENFRGITSKVIEVPPGGIVFRGGNGSGKTSCIDALKTALVGTGLGAEAIHTGADKSSLFVKMTDVDVSRSITSSGVGQPTVKTADAKVMKPQSWLNEKLGLAAFDPIGFFTSKPADRVRLLFDAQPMTVTVERLRTWVPQLKTFDCSGHALEVVRKLHKTAYDMRTLANANAKETKAEAAEAERAASGWKDVQADAGSVESAKAHVTEADRALARLLSAVEAADAHDARTSGSREKIAKLRADATAIVMSEDELIAASTAVDVARESVASREQQIAKLETQLAALRHALVTDQAHLEATTRKLQAVEETRVQAGKLRQQADELEAMLSAAAPERPADKDLEDATRALDSARLSVLAAEHAAGARAAAERRDAAAEKARAAEAEAARLGSIVKALANEAPKALLAEANAIPGLEIDGEAIRLDGVSIDSLSSAEQLRFAVALAKRLNKAPILIFDGLERVDPERQESFVREAGRGGWQVFATCVDRGDLRLEALELDETAAPEDRDAPQVSL